MILDTLVVILLLYCIYVATLVDTLSPLTFSIADDMMVSETIVIVIERDNIYARYKIYRRECILTATRKPIHQSIKIKSD